QSGSTDCAAGSGADVITFAADYTITLVGSQLPVVTSEITITGNGAANTIIQAHANPNVATYRVLRISAAGNLTLDGVTVRNGKALEGGGIYNEGTATISASTLSGNTADYRGGGIYNYGTATVTASTLSGNTATFGGGGISNRASLSVTNSTLAENTATSAGGGAIESGNFGTATLINVTISGNASASQAAVWNEIGTLHLRNTIIANSTGADCQNDDTLGTNVNNLVEDNTCSPALSGDPKLGALANNGGSTQTLVLLVASPAIDAGTNVGCPATDQRGVARPQHITCDIGAYEKIGIPNSPTFADVPADAFGWAYIESIYAAGITGGCSSGPLNYCPNGFVTRAQMAIFLLRGIHGSAYSPPPATGTLFTDVPLNAFAAAWIEQFSTEGITGGCGGGNYCPNESVTRAQMAVFLLRAKHGAAYTPPAASGDFADVGVAGFAAWIEQLAAEGITGGCGGGNYCPNEPVTRAQMAVFIQRTFNLPLP
ncbi:MAG: S-layer homology domain-containing protein, partial [Anaerolineales bacterium]|nr:S-layer homology domain-containing protein [Anaerolineales bacterium]